MKTIQNIKILKVIFNIIIGLLFIILILFCLKYYKHENEMFYIPTTTNTFVNNISPTYTPTSTSTFVNNTSPITTTTVSLTTTPSLTTIPIIPTTTNTFLYTTPTPTNTFVPNTPIDRTKLYGKLELDTKTINKMSNPDIEYDTKRIELTKYSDILL